MIPPLTNGGVEFAAGLRRLRQSTLLVPAREAESRSCVLPRPSTPHVLLQGRFLVGLEQEVLMDGSQFPDKILTTSQQRQNRYAPARKYGVFFRRVPPRSLRTAAPA